MSALYKSVDEQLAAIREAHEAEMQACKDRTLAAEVESALLKEQLAKAVEARAEAEHITTKLLTQFALVSTVFEEARKLALELPPVKTSSNILYETMSLVRPEFQSTDEEAHQ